MTYELTTLENGARVASETMSESHSAAFSIAVDVGARHEEDAENGLSHLLEHMAFKGTHRMNARKIAETFDAMGGNVNAYTSHEQTVYYAKVLKEYAPEALRLLCEIVTDSIFDATELERERDVILQEIAMHKDSPEDVLFDMFQEVVFADQPLGRSILGTEKLVSGFSRDDLWAYTAKHYQPPRIVIAGAGSIEHATVRDIAKEFFIKPKPTDEKAAPPAPASFHTGERVIEKDLEQVQIVVGFPGLPVTDTDYYALQVFSTILGGGMSSRLFQEIREERGLVYSVSSYVSGYQDVGLLGVYAGTSAERLPEFMDQLKRTLETARLGPSAAELLRAKNQLKAGVVMTRESTGAIAEWIARHLHVYGHYRTAEELSEQIEALTAEDITRVADRVLAAAPAVAAIGPVGSLKKAQLADKLAA